MKQNLRNKNGLTFVEVMVTLAVASVFFYGIISTIYSQMKNFQVVRNTITRNELQDKIQKISADPKLISKSIDMAGNEKFKSCFQGVTNPSCDTAPCCNKGFTGAGNDFVFSDPRVPNEKFSGTPANPQRYDMNGVKCNTPSPQCPFVVTSSFEAICPGGIEPCNKAQSILVTYSFGMDRDPTIGFRLPLQTGSVHVSMDSLASVASGGEEFVSVDPPILAFCWTTGTECSSETYAGGSWKVRHAPVGVPVGAKKMLIEYWCAQSDLHFREVGSSTSLPASYLCFGNNPKANEFGQAWVPLSSNLEYEFYYRKVNSNIGPIMFSVIGWSM